MDKSVFKVIGINDNLPEGFRLVEFADLPEVMNNAEKHGILRGEYYLFKQFEKRNKDKYPYSVLWLSRLDYYSIVIGSLMDYDIDRVRGVLIIKETNKKVEESKDGKER